MFCYAFSLANDHSASLTDFNTAIYLILFSFLCQTRCVHHMEAKDTAVSVKEAMGKILQVYQNMTVILW